MKAAIAYIVKAEAETQKQLGALMPHMLEVNIIFLFFFFFFFF